MNYTACTLGDVDFRPLPPSHPYRWGPFSCVAYVVHGGWSVPRIEVDLNPATTEKLLTVPDLTEEERRMIRMGLPWHADPDLLRCIFRKALCHSLLTLGENEALG